MTAKIQKKLRKKRDGQKRRRSQKEQGEEMKTIPWFKECYDLKVAAEKDEPWIKNKAIYVGKSLQMHVGKEYDYYYKRQCSAYGVTPATVPYSDQFKPHVQVKRSNLNGLHLLLRM